jgi:hypothetical protein
LTIPIPSLSIETGQQNGPTNTEIDMTGTLSQETIDAFRKLERGFMKPDFYHGMVSVDSEDGPMPSEDWILNHCPVEEADRLEDETRGWLVRLSAPGYMDCTDWMGPFETEEEAVQAIVDAYAD